MKKRQTQSIRQRRRRGFTLLEVLLVLAILGVIAAMVVPKLIGTQQTAMIDTTKASIVGLKKTLELYTVAHDGQYPETLDELLTPIDKNGIQMQPYLESIPKDAWGEPLNYETETDDNRAGMIVAKIWSNGPDRQNDDGSGDDINNWDEEETQ